MRSNLAPLSNGRSSLTYRLFMEMAREPNGVTPIHSFGPVRTDLGVSVHEGEGRPFSL